MHTIASLAAIVRKQLVEHDIDPTESESIIAHRLHRDLAWVLAHPETQLQPIEAEDILSYTTRRCSQVPLAVLKERKEFYGLSFRVTEDTLVPRPESELLVERAIELLKEKRYGRVIDIGTGSGNLIIAIAKHTPRKTRFSWHACDISKKALDVARSNAETHGIAVRFFHSNLFSHVPQKKYDLIVANLPYLSTEQLAEPSIQREPTGALWGGSNGTEIYRQFITWLPLYLARHGTVLMEIDPSQSTTLARALRLALPGCALAAHADLSGNIRVIEADRP